MKSSDLEGTYRFIRNERVSLPEILSGHYSQTRARAAGQSSLLVLHDTTDVNSASVDFRCHVSLAVELENRVPLGLASVIPSPRGAHEKKAEGAASEQLRWLEGVKASERCLDRRAIHVMDREGDDGKLLFELISSQCAFVIRGRIDRRIAGDDKRVSTALSRAKVAAEREIELPSRRKSGNKEDQKAHPPRDARLATLSIAATSVELETTSGRIPVNIVCVTEVNAPDDVKPVEWLLYSTESISTPEAMLRIVDIYRARWIVEEYFKALKTGCQLEKRQLESYENMLVALGIFVPMALQMLTLRTLARIGGDRPASEVLNPTQLEILRVLPRTANLPLKTVQDALTTVASLGGHLKQNGLPGWLTIGRGLEKLHDYELGWLLARPKDVINA